MSPQEHFSADISRIVWETKYRYRDGEQVHERTIDDTWHRVATSLAAAEPRDQAGWAERFYGILKDFRFLPGGRILAGAGTKHVVTLFNCFVMGVVEDSMDGIFEALKEGGLTMQQGGGVGYDFSTLRPRGTPARRVGTIASGPVSFMRIWDSMCATLLSTGARRGAMMATLRCDHPDIEDFIAAKADKRELRHFNLSVQVTDEFMKAVQEDADWDLMFPASALDGGEGRIVHRVWTGSTEKVPCRVFRTLRAKDLWDHIMRATYEYAEPGVFFVDRSNRLNNLWYREQITATNPCGEIPLQPYGACDLGSLNLTRFIVEPFTPTARLDFQALRETVRTAVRLMDNVIDVSQFPLPAQAEQARGTRRIGLGFTGLADALIFMGLHYDSPAARQFAAEIMGNICHSAYRASIDLAREKGAFPFFERDKYLAGEFVRNLPEDIGAAIGQHGIRNSHLLAIAPTGTISLLADNVSSGLEPVFGYTFNRRVLTPDGDSEVHEVSDHAYRVWRNLYGERPLPPAFTQARSLPPEAHLKMQAALQPYVDNAISKTVNVPSDYPFDAFKGIYAKAYEAGLKGCTTFRPNPVTGAVLEGARLIEPGAPCCGPDREPD